MQSFSFPVSGKIIARATGAALVASLMAGCTTDSLRLQDTMTTGSVANAAPVPPAGVGGGGYAAANAGYGTNDYGNGGYGNGNAGGQAYQPQPAQSASDNRYALAPTTYGASAVEQRPLDAPSATGNVAQSAPTYQPQQQASLAPAAQAPAATTQSAGGNRVTLEPNETLYSVARRYGVPTDALMKANGITDATSVSVGQQLIIPSFSNGSWNAQPAASQQSATQTAAASAGGTYTVQSGDTLSSISRKTGVSLSALRSANSISDDVIRVGQTLNLGGAGTQQVTRVAAANPQTATDATQSAPAQPVTSVQQQSASQQQTETAAAPASQNQPTGYTAPSAAGSEQASDVGAAAQTEQAALVPESTGIDKLRWPVRGRVLTAYGATDGGVRNDGIDISVPEGSEVKAAENGVVIYAGSGLKEFGNTVLVRHDNGLVTVYGHASEIKVSRGDKVQRGQVIASSGMSGSAKQPKLHFEVRENAAPVDPTSFLE